MMIPSNYMNKCDTSSFYSAPIKFLSDNEEVNIGGLFDELIGPIDYVKFDHQTYMAEVVAKKAIHDAKKWGGGVSLNSYGKIESKLTPNNVSEKKKSHDCLLVAKKNNFTLTETSSKEKPGLDDEKGPVVLTNYAADSKKQEELRSQKAYIEKKTQQETASKEKQNKIEEKIKLMLFIEKEISDETIAESAVRVQRLLPETMLNEHFYGVFRLKPQRY
jgi:hypothetical protein